MYAHLRLHTEFSIVDGTCRIDEVVEAAARDGQGALAITDLNNLFAAVKFYSACRKAGIKPLIGCEVSLTLPGVNAAAETSRVLLLAANETGYVVIGFATSAEVGQYKFNVIGENPDSVFQSIAQGTLIVS